MQDNPYMMMLDGIKQQAQAGAFSPVRTGVVVAVAPLAVSTGGITLSGADLLVSAHLMPQSKRVRLTSPSGILSGRASGAASGTLSVDLQSMDVSCTAAEQGVLTVGDRVVLFTEDNNRFIVACKVVGA